ncbi:MAG: hypothetical protein CVT49_00780 [candidate division Zixibacteria bacterium HGW-Zixibacteria-1]|nr:MAG: hypothetical protein CVT49_00780 [candidate division Zixibacteria bacterium HGW-Zixibacteria-1]
MNAVKRKGILLILILVFLMIHSGLILADRNKAIEYCLKGEMLLATSEFEEAIGQFNNAISADSRFEIAYIDRGQTYYLIGEYAKANNDFDQALTINPSSYQALNNRGLVNIELGRDDLAVKDFTKSLTIEETVEAYINRALCNMALGNYSNVVNDCSRAIEISSSKAQFIAMRGAAYYLLGKTDKATSDFDMAYRLEPNSFWSYYFRGLAYIENGEYCRAIEPYSKVLEMEPDYESFYERAQAYEGCGDNARALADYRACFELAPQSCAIAAKASAKIRELD